MSDEEIGEEYELDDEGRLPCGHTPDEHAEMARQMPVGAVNLTMTLPVTGFDPTDGHPILDMDPERGFGLIVDVEIPGPNALKVARNIVTHALGKIDAGIAAEEEASSEGKTLTDDEINAVVADFDPDAAISALLAGTHEAPEPKADPDTDRWEDEGGHG